MQQYSLRIKSHHSFPKNDNPLSETANAYRVLSKPKSGGSLVSYLLNRHTNLSNAIINALLGSVGINRDGAIEPPSQHT